MKIYSRTDTLGARGDSCPKLSSEESSTAVRPFSACVNCPHASHAFCTAQRGLDANNP